MTEVGQELVLELTHRYAAPREDVFDAWINPSVLRRWWAAQSTWETPVADVDPTEGGRYRLSMRTDTGDVHTVGGTFTEFRPPERLSYTWAWEEGPDGVVATGAETLVIVDFLEDGDGTLVRLTHSGFASDEIRDLHGHGWDAVMANLNRQVFRS